MSFVRRVVALLLVLPLLLIALPVQAQGENVTLTILQTSDLHSNLLPYDYYTGNVADWGLARVATLVRQERAADPNLLLLDTATRFKARRWAITTRRLTRTLRIRWP